MATVQDWVTDVAGLLGLVSADSGAPSSDDSALILRVMNRLLDSFNVDSKALFSTQINTFVLIPGHNPHTIYTGGDLSMARPDDIMDAGLIRVGDIQESRVEVLREISQYAMLPDKVTQSPPVRLYYDHEYPHGNVYLNPPPDDAHTLVLYTKVPFNSALALNTAVPILPEGWERALIYNTAVDVAPFFGAGASLTPETKRIAMSSKLIVESYGNAAPIMTVDVALQGPPMYDVKRGRWV